MFTKLALILAYLISILAIFRIVVGFGTVGSPELASRYLGTTNTGEAIDRGIYYLIFAIGLGAVAEISRSLKKIAAVEYE